MIVELTNSNRAKVLYDGLKKAGKLGDYGTVKDLSIQELFETLELNGSERVYVSRFLMALVFVSLLVFRW